MLDTQSFHYSHGSCHLVVTLCARGEERINWSTKAFRTKEFQENPSLYNTESLQHLRNILRTYTDVLAIPSVIDFNGVVERTHTALFERNEVGGVGLVLLYGSQVDGLMFDASDKKACLISSADCPTIVVMAKSGRYVVAHAGRNSLLPVFGTAKISVVENAIRALTSLGDEPSTLRIVVHLGIKAGSFPHQSLHLQYGEKNRAMWQYIRDKGWWSDGIQNEREGLNLFALIRRQAHTLGVYTVVHGDFFDTYKDPRWWSARRGDTERNGVLVRRR